MTRDRDRESQIPDLARPGDSIGGGHTPIYGCVVKQLPPDEMIIAARRAVDLNPQNAVTVASASAGALLSIMPPEHIAILTKKRWAPGTTLTIGFLEPTPADLQARILAHAQVWRDRGANISFALSQVDPTIRITREGEGYWSYLGTDILSIPANQPTLCLQAFSMATPESEYRRVVRHEIGHALSAPHEHMRAGIVARLDPAKTIAYFRATQGWSEQMVREQVLAPLDEASLMGTPVDVDSIMAYSLPASITRDGRPIPGGLDIDDSDAKWMARIYPGLMPIKPTPPGPKPAANRVRGYVALTSTRVPRKLVVYVPDGAGGEAGWQYDGPFLPSKGSLDVAMFDGAGKRV